jgi:hypothetical protein
MPPISPSDKRRQTIAPVCALVALGAGMIPITAPTLLLWTAPSILAAAMPIAWAAESAQFFIAQGFALAILAWLQTLPGFAVEAALAWKQQGPLLRVTSPVLYVCSPGWAGRWSTPPPPFSPPPERLPAQRHSSRMSTPWK